MSEPNYRRAEAELAKYKNETEKCHKDLRSLNKNLQSAQGANVEIAKKNLRLRKAECAEIKTKLEPLQVSLAGKDRLVRYKKDLENQLMKVRKSIRYLEVSLADISVFISNYF